MAKFRVRFTRDVLVQDEVTREIEADSQDEAEDVASRLCDEFDSDCPDDVEQIAGCQPEGFNFLVIPLDAA